MLVLLRDKEERGTETVEISQKLINAQLNHFVYRGVIQNTHHMLFFILVFYICFLGESRPGELQQFFDSTKGTSELCMCDLVC